MIRCRVRRNGGGIRTFGSGPRGVGGGVSGL